VLDGDAGQPRPTVWSTAAVARKRVDFAVANGEIRDSAGGNSVRIADPVCRIQRVMQEGCRK
jgi:hypothetical protein